MSEHKMPANGAFCWNELATTDLEAAQNFYRELLGWEIQESKVTGTCEGAPEGAAMVYSEIVVAGQHVGGMYKMGPEMAGTPSHWIAYVAVDDVDAKAQQVSELGGKIIVPPMDIPNVGRFCVINDPTGAAISLITLKGQAS
ncbi:MAG TPA: VOC family protein [Pyrinomonadaceae bacterium]|nr:VOC family protein [Pyrinomonadaceae bacterium]